MSGITMSDAKAKAKGMRYKVAAVNGEIETLYCRSIEQVTIALKDWPGIKFRISSLKDEKETLRDFGVVP